MKYYRCRSCDEVYPEDRLWTKPIEITDGYVAHIFICPVCGEDFIREITEEEYEKSDRKSHFADCDYCKHRETDHTEYPCCSCGNHEVIGFHELWEKADDYFEIQEADHDD